MSSAVEADASDQAGAGAKMASVERDEGIVVSSSSSSSSTADHESSPPSTASGGDSDQESKVFRFCLFLKKKTLNLNVVGHDITQQY